MSRRAAGAGVVAGLAAAWNFGNIGAVADTLAGDYGVGLATIGLFTTALFVTHAGVQLPGGRAIDRLGAPAVILGGLLVIAAGNAAALAAPDAGLALGARALIGVGTGSAWIAGSDLVRAGGGSAFAQGLFGGVGLSGAGIALGVLPPLEPLLGWRTPYLASLALAAVAVAALALVPREAWGRRSRGSHPRPAVRALLGDARLQRLAATYAATGGVAIAVGNWVPTLLHHAGYSKTVAGAVSSLTLGCAIVSRPLGGWIFDRRPSWTPRALGLSLGAGALGIAVIAATPPPAAAAAATALVGVAAGIGFAPCFTGAALVRPDAPGAAVGFVNTVATGTIVAATPLLGLTFALPGNGRIGLLAAAFAWALPLLALPRALDLGLTAKRARGPERA